MFCAQFKSLPIKFLAQHEHLPILLLNVTSVTQDPQLSNSFKLHSRQNLFLNFYKVRLNFATPQFESFLFEYPRLTHDFFQVRNCLRQHTTSTMIQATPRLLSLHLGPQQDLNQSVQL